MSDINFFDFLYDIGGNIKRYRKCAKMTQDELAEALHLKSRATIAGYEQGKIKPPIDTLYEMSRILKVSLIDLIADQGTDWETVLSKQELLRDALLSSAGYHREMDVSVIPPQEIITGNGISVKLQRDTTEKLTKECLDLFEFKLNKEIEKQIESKE